eukprot:SAG31_NODE_20817_length_564_cov_2.475269_1_plen_140_part_01
MRQQNRPSHFFFFFAAAELFGAGDGEGPGAGAGDGPAVALRALSRLDCAWRSAVDGRRRPEGGGVLDRAVERGRDVARPVAACRSLMRVRSESASLSSEDSAAVDSAEGSADQSSSGEYSELKSSSTLQMGAPGSAPVAG